MVSNELANLSVMINCETEGVTILTWSDAIYHLEGTAEVRLSAKPQSAAVAAKLSFYPIDRRDLSRRRITE